MTAEEVAEVDRALAAGGVALFPADTVYGLAADAESAQGVRRLYEIKRRPPMPAAVMFFALEPALAALPDLGPRTREALERLLPGPLTLILPNPRRAYPLAGVEATGRLGVRVPRLEGPLAPLTAVSRPVIQSSANLHGGPEARRLEEVAPEVRSAVDLALDGGELPGIASTVVDLGDYEDGGGHVVLREGAVDAAELKLALP